MRYPGVFSLLDCCNCYIPPRTNEKSGGFLITRLLQLLHPTPVSYTHLDVYKRQIEGIVTTNTRIRQLVGKKTTPKNRDEQEIAGYRDVLNMIHESFDAIPITQNYILQLHKILYSHMYNPMTGKTKSVQNYISATYPDGHVEILFTPLSPYETPEALDKICEEYNRVIGNMEVEPLIAIPVFIHDFLCIHPFLSLIHI